MPDSTPNDFGVSGGGDVTSQFLQVVPTGVTKRIKWGKQDAFINGGSQTDTTQVFHGLGAVPELILMTNVYADNGRFQCFIHTQFFVPDANVFYFFAYDIAGLAHGPGQLGAVFQWMVIGAP